MEVLGSPRAAPVTTDPLGALGSGEKQEIAPRTGRAWAVPTPPAQQRRVWIAFLLNKGRAQAKFGTFPGSGRTPCYL